jgi:predicted aminopeptidase
MKSMRTAAVLIVLAPLASSCSLPFYWQAVSGQFDMLRRRTPIDVMLEDPDVDPGLRNALSEVAEIRRFAIENLELPDNGSYTTYADLERPYAVWNVVAAEEFSIDPIRWCFPFAGCVAYRGFFDREDAERFRRKLAARGLDTYSGGASAYSTLGYFSDPILNTMLAGGADEIAPLLFHELAHQKLYFKGDSELSEAFASVIEEFGTERWLAARPDNAVLVRYRRRARQRAEFADLVARTQQRLAHVYARKLPVDQMRLAKEAVFEKMRAEYAELRESWGPGANYDGWFEQPLTNASLASVATYRRWLPALRARLAAVGLTRFYADMADLERLSPEERVECLQAWQGRRSAAGTPAKPR